MRRHAVTLLALTLALAALPRSAVAQAPLWSGVFAALADHRVNIGEGVERSSGTVLGAAVGVAWNKLQLEGSLAAGDLGALNGNGVSRSMSEARLDASRAVRSWLVLHAGTVTRRYSSPLAAQRWVIARTGAEGRITFLDDALVAGTLLTFDPVVSVSGTRRPNMSIGASTSLAYTAGRLSVRLAQSLERADFPPRDGKPRLEQLSMLTLGVGWRLR
ncbi:MAG: hypothetical protein M3068_06280 [Gemmatimonadota bacterium]|nr:hypothetical protein [Gemmatimonadota bacterium]